MKLLFVHILTSLSKPLASFSSPLFYSIISHLPFWKVTASESKLKNHNTNLVNVVPSRTPLAECTTLGLLVFHVHLLLKPVYKLNKAITYPEIKFGRGAGVLQMRSRGRDRMGGDGEGS